MEENGALTYFISLPPVPCRLGGILYVSDREAGFGLASQEPWIQHASVRDNILFGKPYDPLFYQAVIEACALSDDLKVNFLPSYPGEIRSAFKTLLLRFTSDSSPVTLFFVF